MFKSEGPKFWVSYRAELKYEMIIIVVIDNRETLGIDWLTSTLSVE